MNAANSDMLLEMLIARTIGEESVLAMNLLRAAPVPGGVLRYLRAEILNRLAEDLSHAPHFARVASPTAGPDAVRDALLGHAAEQYIFPRDEFLRMLENAVRFTENYLCRPRWTLSSFLFLDQPAITTETLLRKLEYISDYAYLPQLLRRMVTHSGKQVITSHECIAHINRIDDAVIREHSPRERALLTKPIFQFYLLSPDIENKPIALRPLLLFLEDKQFGPMREYTEGIWHIRGKSEITMEEYVALNEDFATGRSSFAPTPTVVEPPPEPTPEQAVPERVPSSEIPPPAELAQESLPFVERLPAEPVRQEGAAPELVQTEAANEEPVQQEAATTEPAQQEAPAPEFEQQEAATTEPEQQEASAPELVQREAAKEEPVQQEAATTEPAQQEASAPEFAQQEAAKAEPAQQEASAPEFAQQEAAKAEPAQAEAAPVENPQQNSLAAELMKQQAAPEPAQAEAAPVEPLQHEPVSAEPEVPAALLPPSLNVMIPANLRRRFVNVICGRDSEFYDLVIARLDEMHSWPQASAYIRELFEINSIDPFNDTAIAFTDVIQKRCDQSRMNQK